MNKVLERQLKKFFGSLEAVPKELSPLFEAVGNTYDHADDDRMMVERSLEISSKELGDLNARLQIESDALATKIKEVERSKTAILNLLEDIESDKKKVEQVVVVRTQQLNAEKARLLASINSLSFGFVIVDPFTMIQIKNPALSKILEIIDEPHSLVDIAQLFPTVDLVRMCKKSASENAVVEHSEVAYGKKSLRIFCAPVIEMVEQKLQVIGNVILFEDITEAKVLERSRDEFFAVASHELRTPLTAIHGNAEMMLDMFGDKIVDDDMRGMLNDINLSSIRLISIVNDFLEASRLEQGTIEIKTEEFDVREVIDKVVRDFKELVKQKGIELVFRSDSSHVPNIVADKNRVEQILVNLVGNSAKFTTQGSITISISEEGAFLRFRVRDTGSGISEHNQRYLFRKFQPAGEQTLARDVSQSTGLGLYICKLIVNAMSGDIGLEKSEDGKGSTFYFTLPIAPGLVKK